ncbi:hypothetical protein BOX15_Mlig016356g4, partial [Macrostomum lignano]
TSSESMIRNSVAIVTGGGRGIGRAIAESLLVRQARRVIVADLNEATGGQAVQELNETHGSGRCHFVRCSVTDRAELRRVFQKAIELDGRVDIVANNAGVANEADPDLTIDVNVKGVIYGSQMAVEFMSKQSGPGLDHRRERERSDLWQPDGRGVHVEAERRSRRCGDQHGQCSWFIHVRLCAGLHSLEARCGGLDRLHGI